MRLFRPCYALSLAALALAVLAGGGLDWALAWMHDRVLSSSSSAIGETVVDGVGGEPRPPRPRVDSVVVLGYALNRDGSPSPALEHRVRSAVREWERASSEGEDGARGKGKGGRRRRAKLVFSGGHPGGGVRRRSEAAVMRDLAQRLLSEEQGGGERDISSDWLLEESSTSTWENAVESLRILSDVLPEEEGEGEGEGCTAAFSVSVATSPFHQRRALAVFQCAAAARRRRRTKTGGEGNDRGGEAEVLFSISAAASPRPPPANAPERFGRAFEAAREVAAIAWYWARGRLCEGLRNE